MLEFIGIFLALVGILFAFEAPRNAFLRLFRRNAQVNLHTRRLSPESNTPDSRTISKKQTFGATQSGRQPFFINEPFTELRSAKHVAQKSKRPLFLVIYDDSHPTKSELYYSLGCFLNYFTTKRLVDDHFVSALLPSTSDSVRELIPSDDPLENCLWVVISHDGKILRCEGVYANPDEGLKRVRSVIAELDSKKPNKPVSRL